MKLTNSPKVKQRPMVSIDGVVYDYNKLNATLSQVANAAPGVSYNLEISPESSLDSKQDFEEGEL